MNIYKFFETPTELDGYDNRITTVPQLAYEHAIQTRKRFPEGERAIMSNPKHKEQYEKFLKTTRTYIKGMENNYEKFKIML